MSQPSPRSPSPTRCGVVIWATVSGWQDPHAAVLPALEHHLAVHGQVVGGREQPGMPGDAAQQIGPRVVHFAPHPAAVALLGRRRPLPQRFVGQVARLGHAQRAEDVLPAELVDGRCRRRDATSSPSTMKPTSQ